MTGDFFLTQWFFLGMRWLCENVVSGNVFLTILLSTLILRLITLFSDIKQRKNTMKTAQIQPEVEKLQKRYKDNPQKLQQEQQKLMKENGISMFSGCLPTILTLVLLFCFIAAFRFWGYEQNVKMINEMSSNIAEAMREEGLADESESSVDCILKLKDMSEEERESFLASSNIEISKTFTDSKFLWINNIWQPDNGFSPVVTEANTFFGANYKSTKKLIYFKEHKDIKQEMTDLGIFYDETEGYDDLSKDEQNKLKENAAAVYEILMTPLEKVHEGHNNGWFILPVLATLFQVLYMLYTQKSMKTAQSSAQPGASTANFMLWMMPIMSFFFCLSYTSAFALYWTLSSIMMLIINMILSKVFNNKKQTVK